MKIYRASDLFLEAKTICSLFYFSFHKGEIGKTALKSVPYSVLRIWDIYVFSYSSVFWGPSGSSGWEAAGWLWRRWGQLCPLRHRWKRGGNRWGRLACICTYIRKHAAISIWFGVKCDLPSQATWEATIYAHQDIFWFSTAWANHILAENHIIHHWYLCHFKALFHHDSSYFHSFQLLLFL